MDKKTRYHEALKADVMDCMDYMATLPKVPPISDFKEIGSTINRHHSPAMVGMCYTLAALYTDIVCMWCVLVEKHPHRKTEAIQRINEALENSLTILTDWQ